MGTSEAATEIVITASAGKLTPGLHAQVFFAGSAYSQPLIGQRNFQNHRAQALHEGQAGIELQ